MAQHMDIRDNPYKSIGIYRHYKNGKDYQLIGQGIDTETKEKVAVYKALYSSYQLFVRPWSIFFEFVENDGKKIPRFKKVL